MKTRNTAVSFRTIDTIKNEAYKIIETYGFTPSQVFNLFLAQIANTKTVPLNLDYLQPNERTLKSISDAKNNKIELISPAGSYESIVDLLRAKSSNFEE